MLSFLSQDFKKTTKLTWIAESAKAPLLPTIAVQFDDVISKPVLTKNDDFKDYINKDSKVRHQADGRVNITVEFNIFNVKFSFSFPNFSVTRLKQRFRTRITEICPILCCPCAVTLNFFFLRFVA